MQLDINRWNIYTERKEDNYKYVTGECSICGESIKDIRKDTLKKRQCLCTRRPVKEQIEKGHKFGNLTVIKEIESKKTGLKPVRMFLLECFCGNVVEKQIKSLRQGTRCCGCTHMKPGYPATAKVGDLHQTNEGYTVEIVEYIDASNIRLKFLDNNGAIVKTNIQAARNGAVSNPYHKSVYGVACYGEPSDDWRTCKPIYMTWAGMMERVYVPKAWEKHPNYEQCRITEPWHNFANYYEWAKYQVGSRTARWQLDKDIICKGNKLYAPEFCAYVPSQLNALFTKREAERGDYPIGVMSYKTRQGNPSLHAMVCDPDLGKRITGCGGGTVEECFNWYKSKKEEIIQRQAEKYKNQIDPRVYEALYKYEVEITD